MQHNLRDPSRDRTHGRIYRVTYEGRPLLKPPAKIAGEPIEQLLDLLKEPEDRVRYRVKTELGARDTDQVVAAVKSWVAYLDRNDINYEHHLLEALWVHQFHDVVNLELLDRLLTAQRLPRPGRGHAGALLLARPGARRSGAAQEAGRRPLPSRPARGRPRRQASSRCPKRSKFL